jgi:hypothetical protein
MSEDPHPKIKEQAAYDGHLEAKHGPLRNDEFTVLQQYKMMLHPPENRVEALRKVDDAIAQSDGTSLRSKAQLLNLRRELSKTHTAMTKVGR